ncbi:hypothetical protein XJ44_06535 [Thermosipho affectus]|uniref:HTH cro/C1-type domain-containing protein n=1 Tax=Thermosipho affectus TaxID=660294 RepID=A0ABX3IGJ3_9BACT|nr:hypothetical protein [Thermosipho affectus]ONN26945.1 hypothetical protein XJ44_06535 [Thermosipho affectus]
MDGWKEISYILKKEVASSKVSLLKLSEKLEIDIENLRRYFEGDFSGEPEFIKDDLKKLRFFFNISEDLTTLFELGKSQREFPLKRLKNIYVIYFLLFISGLLFFISVKLLIEIYKAPLVTLRSQKEIVVDGKVGRIFSLGIGEHVVNGKALLLKINNEKKLINMYNFKVVIKWEK